MIYIATSKCSMPVQRVRVYMGVTRLQLQACFGYGGTVASAEGMFRVQAYYGWLLELGEGFSVKQASICSAGCSLFRVLINF